MPNTEASGFSSKQTSWSRTSYGGRIVCALVGRHCVSCCAILSGGFPTASEQDNTIHCNAPWLYPCFVHGAIARSVSVCYNSPRAGRFWGIWSIWLYGCVTRGSEGSGGTWWLRRGTIAQADIT